MNTEAWNLWGEDLTDKELLMVSESGRHVVDEAGAIGNGVELRGGSWTTARSLVRKGLGFIDGEGGPFPAMFFANDEGVRIAHEFDDNEDDAADNAFDAFFEELARAEHLA